MLATYDIELTNVVSPWPEDEVDWDTYKSRSINIIESIDPITLSIVAQDEINETATKLIYKLVLSQPVTTDMTVTIMEKDGNTFSKLIKTGTTELSVEKELTAINDFYKNSNEYSLEIIKVQLSNGKEFEELNIDPKKKIIKVVDNIDSTFIDLTFMDIKDGTTPITDVLNINDKVILMANITNPSSYDINIELESGETFTILANTTELNCGEFILPSTPGLFTKTIKDIFTDSSMLLEKVESRNSASVESVLPSNTHLKLTGPLTITEGIPFDIILETEYASVEKDIKVKDDIGNIYTLPKNTKSITINQIISDDIYTTPDYSKKIVNVIEKGDFSNVDISGSTDFPIEVNIPLTEIKDLKAVLFLEYSNVNTNYFVEKQNGLNSTKVNEDIPVKISLKAEDSDSNIYSLKSKESFEVTITNSYSNTKITFPKDVETHDVLIPAYYDSSISGYDDYDTITNNFSIVDANLDQFELSEIDSNELSFNVRRWRQAFIKVVAQSDEYNEGDDFCNVDLISNLKPMLGNLDVKVNIDGQDDFHPIQLNTLKSTIQIPIKADDAYSNMAEITFKGVDETKYYGNPEPTGKLIFEKDFQEAYVLTDGSIVKINDTIDPTYVTFSGPSNTLEGNMTIPINYSYTTDPDPDLDTTDLKLKLVLTDPTSAETFPAKFINLTDFDDKIGTFDFVLPNPTNGGDFELSIEHIEGGNYEKVISSNTVPLKIITAPNKDAIVSLKIAELTENDSPFEIEAFLKNSDGVQIKPKNNNLNFNILINFSDGNTVTKNIQFIKADDLGVGGESYKLNSYSDEIVGNDYYKDSAPKVSISISSDESDFNAADYGFNSLVFETKGANSIISTPKDFIDDTVLKISKVEIIEDNNSIIQKYQTIGCKFNVDVELTIPPLIDTLIEIIDGDNNTIGSGTILANDLNCTIICTSTKEGELVPKISGLSNNPYENLIIKDNSLSINISNTPNVILKLVSDTTSISEESSTDSSVSDSFELGIEIESALIFNNSDFTTTNIDADDLDLLKNNINDNIKVDMAIENTINDDIKNTSFTSYKKVVNGKVINTLEDTFETNISNLDNMLINNDDKIMASIGKVHYDKDNLTFSPSNSILEIEVVDEAVKDSVLISLEPVETDPTKQTIIESGGYVKVNIKSSVVLKNDLTTKIKITDVETGNYLKDVDGNDLIYEIILYSDMDDLTKSLHIPSFDNVYKNNNSKIKFEIVLEDSTSTFEKLEVDPDKNSFEFKVEDSIQTVRFSVYLQRDPDDPSKLLKRVSNDMVITDTAGPGESGSKMPTYYMIFNGFMITTDGEEWNGIPLGQSGSNVSRYLTKDDFRDTDFIELRYTEYVSGSDLIAYRSRIIKITKNHLEDIIPNQIPQGFDDSTNQKIAYTLEHNLWDVSFDDTTGNSGTTREQEMINRINAISDYSYSDYLLDPNNPPLKHIDDFTPDSNQWVVNDTGKASTITKGVKVFFAFEGKVINHSFEDCKFIDTPTDDDWKKDFQTGTRATMVAFDQPSGEDGNAW